MFNRSKTVPAYLSIRDYLDGRQMTPPPELPEVPEPRQISSPTVVYPRVQGMGGGRRNKHEKAKV